MARNQNRRNRPRGQGGRKGNGRGYLEPPTSRQLGRQNRAATDLKFKPLERAIEGDLRASERRVGEQGDWWANYNAVVNQGRADTAAAYQQAAATGQAQVAQASQIDNANTGTLNDEAAKSAALRGANTSTAPQERAAAAQAQRNYLAAAQGNATAQAGANQFAYLTDQKRIGAGQANTSREKEQRRGTSIRQDLRNTRQERGSYKVADRAEREEKARNYQLQRGAFGLDKRTAAADAAQGASDAAQKERENREDNAQDEKGSIRSAKGGGLTPSQRRAAKRARHNAMTAAKTLYSAAGRPSWSDKQWTVFVQRVAMEDGIDYTAAARAVATLRRRAERGSGSGAAQGTVHR